LPLVVPGKQPVNNTLSNISNYTTKTPVPSSNTSNKTVSLPGNTSNKTATPSDNASNSSKGAADYYNNTSTGTINPGTPVSVTSEVNKNSAENNSSLSENTQSGDSEQNNGSSNGGSNSESSGGSGGSSSGSSGGGVGGSPEPAKNVEVKELSQAFITSGKEVQFNFTENATCVVHISFDSKKTLGKTTTIAEMLKEKSALVSELPAGEVYRSFNVWVGNEGTASSNNIENPVVCFKVEKSWLEDKGVDPASLTLNQYNEKEWEKSPVNMIGEDEKYLYFTANVSGYSSFAITGSKTGSKTGSIPGKVKSYLEQQEDSAQENSLLGTGSSRITGKTNDNAIKGETEKSTPGFELVCGIVSLLGVFLYRRSK